MDIEGVLMKQGKKLNFSYITDILSLLCELKEEPEILERLNKRINAILT